MPSEYPPTIPEQLRKLRELQDLLTELSRYSRQTQLISSLGSILPMLACLLNASDTQGVSFWLWLTSAAIWGSAAIFSLRAYFIARQMRWTNNA